MIDYTVRLKHNDYKKESTTDSEMRSEYLSLYKKYNDLQDNYTSLLKETQKFVDSMKSKKNNNQLNHNQLKKILMLCHPDKHNGSKLSNEVTRLLISMLEE